MFKLILVSGEPRDAEYILKPGENVIGRSRSTEIKVSAMDVSGRHARLLLEGGVVLVENLSQYGTFIDTEPVEGRVEMKPGSILKIGKMTELQLKSMAALQPAPELLEDAPATRAAVDGNEGPATGDALERSMPLPAPALASIPAPIPASIPAPALEPALAPAPAPAPIPAPVPAATPAPTRAMQTTPMRAAASGAALAPTRAAAPARRPAPPLAGVARRDTECETSGFDDSLTIDAGGGSYDDEEGATRAMQTRAATPDEIQILREHESRRAKRKTITIISVVAVLLAIGVIFRPRRPPPELEIDWPKNKQGVYQHRFEPGISGGIAKGEYDLRYPDNGTFKKGEIVGGYTFSGFVGRDLNVPVRIFLQEEVDLRLASMTQEQIVSDWIEMVGGSGGVWRFNEPSTLAVFFGEKNGIPYTRITYLRDDNGSWFGVANVFRHGRRRIVARAEAPAMEQARVENLLSSRLIYVADALEFSYWPYTPGLAAVSVKDELDEAQHDLERMAPGTWMSIDKQLCALLSRVVPQEDIASESECLRLLTKLRESEALWFNSQQLSFESYKLSGDLKTARKVSVFTKGVFSEMSDQRFYTVRKWNLEL